MSGRNIHEAAIFYVKEHTDLDVEVKYGHDPSERVFRTVTNVMKSDTAHQERYIVTTFVKCHRRGERDDSLVSTSNDSRI